MSNPLTSRDWRIPFNRISAEHVEPAVDQLLEQAERRLNELAAAGGERTFENTLLAVESLAEDAAFAMKVAGHLESVRTSEALRQAYNAVQPKFSAFCSSIPLHADLWEKLKEYSRTDEARRLAGVRARFLSKELDEFRRGGADLDSAGKKRLQAINVRLAQATQKFSENVLDATNAFELIIDEEGRLSGLPASAVEAARESAAKKGLEGWRFTLQQPSVHAVLTYLDNPHIREQVWRAQATRAAADPFDNRGLIVEILKLRREKARLLGYRDFADLALEDRMAGSGRRAREFVEDLEGRTRAAFEQENERLRGFRMSLEGSSAVHMEPWDTAYYAEKLRRAEYDFDEERLRPYFPYEAVKEGMFQLAGRLFGVEARPDADAPVWHEDVQAYGLYDADGSRLGIFYTDYFPREDKRGGAWMDHLFTGRPTADGREPHVGLTCGNLTPPLDGRPALLTHRDVETLFHEFGHLLHHLLSRVEIPSLAGTNVAWDFVELPSQLMENWCWEREALDLFARHWETNEPIPDDLFQKLKRARNFRAANSQMRQLGLATLDLALHVDYDPERDGDDVLGYARGVLARFAPTPLPRDYAMPAAFSHLFADPIGYAAGYYSYKWAETLDADAFTEFAAAGIFDRGVGRRFRETILEKGDSEPPEKLFRDFMGRDPEPAALLRRLGLAA